MSDGSGEAATRAIAGIVAALHAGDTNRVTDLLLEIRDTDPADALAVLATLADRIVHEGLPGFSPDATVDDITVEIARRSGAAVTLTDVERVHRDAMARERGRRSRRALIRSGVLSAAELQSEPERAYDELAALRTERDSLEAQVDELAGARALADELGAELEREEWIRARLGKAKAPAPAREVAYFRPPPSRHDARKGS